MYGNIHIWQLSNQITDCFRTIMHIYFHYEHWDSWTWAFLSAWKSSILFETEHSWTFFSFSLWHYFCGSLTQLCDESRWQHCRPDQISCYLSLGGNWVSDIGELLQLKSVDGKEWMKYMKTWRLNKQLNTYTMRIWLWACARQHDSCIFMFVSSLSH